MYITTVHKIYVKIGAISVPFGYLFISTSTYPEFLGVRTQVRPSRHLGVKCAEKQETGGPLHFHNPLQSQVMSESIQHFDNPLFNIHRNTQYPHFLASKNFL